MVNIGSFLGKITIAIYVSKNLTKITFVMIIISVLFALLLLFSTKFTYIYILL